MKNLSLILIMFLPWNIFAQVAIGKTSITNSSVSLEFGSANRGMILPWVSSATSVTGAVNGTMIYDLSDHKIKVKYNSAWKDLSVDISGTTIDPVSSIDGVTIQNTVNENIGAKTAIGPLSSTPGILVLENNNKAMILPKVASPYLNIIDPSPGMIVYDTTKKLLAVFNGKVWSFWKP
ncbi:hypothetical protein [Chryseobacterium sp. OV279]|uniref:hypothetical protein n=1 Tax=Chryseobacterium sp. OV279 TaxID=1500285 RepID=UPI00091E5C56|nr:hypothetical protein [Chryseobacterium sp. OV279]SHF79439.1 hypothetical protein SAMN02787100_2611 [Chryseobacterium sp. OV279]